MALLVVGVTRLLNSPRVQQRVSVVLATELENRIGTRVSLGGVRWLFPNDLVVDSLTIDDQEGEHLLSVSRIAAKVEWLPLLKHRQLSIRNIRFFYPDINLYKPEATDDYNYQFLLDAFATKKETTEPSRLSLRINTLLVRHACFRHRVGEAGASPASSFTADDVAVDDLSAQLSLKMLSADSISLVVRHLNFCEQSGLRVDDCYLRLVGNRSGATLANFRLDLPHSTLRLDTVWASYQMEEPKLKIHHPVLKGKVLSTSYVTPGDLKCFFPQLGGITEKVRFGADFIGSTSRINLKELKVRVGQKDVSLRADGTANLKDWKRNGSIELNLHEAALTDKAWAMLLAQAPEIYAMIPQEVVRIGDISARGSLRLTTQQGCAELYAMTDAGEVEVDACIDADGRYTTHIDGQNVNIAQVVPSSPLTRTNVVLDAKGIYDYRRDDGILPLQGTFTGIATQTRLLGYNYEKVALNGAYSHEAYSGSIDLDDPNGSFRLRAEYKPSGHTPSYSLQLQADTLNLHAMQLLEVHEGNRFSVRVNADIRGQDFNHFTGQIFVDSLILHKPDEDYMVEQIALYGLNPDRKMLSLSSDFMEGALQGQFTYQLLPQSLVTHLHRYLPSVCRDHMHSHQLADNLCTATLKVTDDRPFREFLLLPVSFDKPISVEALINDHADNFSLQALAPSLQYGEVDLSNLSVRCETAGKGVSCRIGGTQHSADGISTTANLLANAHDDKVALGLLWNSNPQGLFDGALYSDIGFSFNGKDELGITVECDSSYATINHSAWELHPFRMEYTPQGASIHGFRFEHDSDQYLSINGSVADTSSDTLQVRLNNLDLDYLLTLVKLEGISFGGNVSGYINATDLYSEPYLDARINAQDLTFCEGPLGDAAAYVYWNSDSSRIDFTVDVEENKEHTTNIEGYADIADRFLWLDIDADSTNISFLNSMLGGFMDNIKGNASGNIIVGGPMDAIDLDGTLLADVSFRLTPTNTDYYFRDSIRLKPGVIRFDGIEAFDLRHQKAIVAGSVTHNKLSDYAYDLYVDVQNVLGIDLPDTGDDSFYTTIYGTGGVHIKGTPDTPLSIEIQAQPEKGSLFALNLASQDVSSSEAFITFTDRSAKRNVPTVATRPAGRGRAARAGANDNTSLNLDIMAHVTPDATLKLVMNQAVDDHISATGSGDLQISIHDDDISLFGTYTVSRGFYRLSLQDVINKNFDVLSGSTVSFEGDPMNARLDITARHVVNYVPLKDLSPDMNGNVHVNCLLRIGGTLNAPTVTFDLELPQGTEEEKSVLRSYTSTEEQMNLQFIYLLGLSKFYTPDMARNAQGTTNNMESLISSTISGQVNNILSGIIDNENWNLASNIRAENMMTGANDLSGDNWDNMEIEGILEGRLLDNRLLVNGNFGYRDNPMYATNFIGDFDIRYLLNNSFSLKGYNKTNDRYFSKTSLTTQGIGLVFQREFDNLFPRRNRNSISSEEPDSVAVSGD